MLNKKLVALAAATIIGTSLFVGCGAKEEAKTESDFRKINEEKYSEINESIKQLKALKFEEVEQELIANEKNKQQINVPDDFDSQTI